MSTVYGLDFESRISAQALAESWRTGIQQTRQSALMQAGRGRITFGTADRLDASDEPGHPFVQVAAEYANIPLGRASGQLALVTLHLYSDRFRTYGKLRSCASGLGSRGPAIKFLNAALAGLQAVDPRIPSTSTQYE